MISKMVLWIFPGFLFLTVGSLSPDLEITKYPPGYTSERNFKHRFLGSLKFGHSDFEIVRLDSPNVRRARLHPRTSFPLHLTAFGKSYNLTLTHNRELFSTYGDYSLPIIVSTELDSAGSKLINWRERNVWFFQDPDSMSAFAVTFLEDGKPIFEGIIREVLHDIIVLPMDGETSGHHGVYRRHRKSMDILDEKESPLPVVTSDSDVMHGRVEMFIWTDFSFYESYQSNFKYNSSDDLEYDILKYVAILANAADLMYRKAFQDPSLRIDLSLTGVRLCKSRNCSQFTESIRVNNTVNNHKALDLFAKELKRDYNLHRFNFRFDHATALTRLILTDPVTNPIGVSFTDKICSLTDGKSSSLVRDQGGFTGIDTLVHEIAHTLGSDHDGWGRGSGCQASDGHIMSPIKAYNINSFLFSRCSLESIKINLRKPSSSCLFDFPHSDLNLPEFSKIYPGQLYNRSEQCGQVYGTDFCLSINTRLVDICTKMWCWDPARPNYCVTKMHAALGTSCGQKQWCVGGKCLYDVRAP